jgi:CRP-like cAMP-binding protein
MVRVSSSAGRQGPVLRTIDPWAPSTGRMRQRLTADERARLAVMASVVQFKKGEVIYREGDRSEAIFNVISGVVTSYKKVPGGGEHIVAFLLPDDLFGLCEEGRYINSTKAVVPVTAYSLPVIALRKYLSQNAELEYHVICRLCQELAQAQRHAFLLCQRSAVSRVVMFLRLIEQSQVLRDEERNEVYLPMDRSDIAEYTGMTLPTVSRAFRSLATSGIIKVRNRRHVRIIDRTGFDKIAGDRPSASAIEVPNQPRRAY